MWFLFHCFCTGCEAALLTFVGLESEDQKSQMQSWEKMLGFIETCDLLSWIPGE